MTRSPKINAYIAVLVALGAAALVDAVIHFHTTNWIVHSRRRGGTPVGGVIGQVEDLRAGQRARDGVDQSDDRLHDAAQKVDRRAQETAQQTDGAGLRRRIVLDDDVDRSRRMISGRRSGEILELPANAAVLAARSIASTTPLLTRRQDTNMAVLKANVGPHP